MISHFTVLDLSHLMQLYSQLQCSAWAQPATNYQQLLDLPTVRPNWNSLPSEIKSLTSLNLFHVNMHVSKRFTQ